VTARRGAAALLADLKVVLVPWLTARALLVAGYVVAVAAADRLVADDKPRALSEGLIAWDGTWYRDIAAHGYHSLPDEALRFFPLFPLLGKAFSVVTAGRVDVALVVIANVASLALAVAIRRLVRFERGNVALADRAVWMVCLFPGAFVLAWGYAEALWLLAAVVVFWGIRSRHWWWAVAAGVVAGASRPLGIVLVVPAAIELARVWRSARTDEKVSGVAAVVSPLLGAGAYLVWVGSSYGNFRLPFSTQGPLRGETINPLSRLWEGLHQMVGPDRFSDGLHVPFALAFVVLLVLTFRWWPASYGEPQLARALRAQRLPSGPEPRRDGEGPPGRQGAHDGARRWGGGAELVGVARRLRAVAPPRPVTPSAATPPAPGRRGRRGRRAPARRAARCGAPP
jgi:hypothetical protein